MRILSQDGYDYPYDSIIVLSEGKYVQAKLVNNPSSVYVLGTYKSTQRAMDVTDAIREFYLGKAPDQTAVFNMPEE